MKRLFHSRGDSVLPVRTLVAGHPACHCKAGCKAVDTYGGPGDYHFMDLELAWIVSSLSARLVVQIISPEPRVRRLAR